MFFALFIYLLIVQITAFSNEWEPFKIKLLEAINQLSTFLAERFNISTEKQLDLLKNSINNSGSQLIAFLRAIAYSFSETVFFILIIPVFSALILYHRQLLANTLYQNALDALLPYDEKATRLRELAGFITQRSF